MKKLYKLFLALVLACAFLVGVQPVEAGMISVEQEVKMGKETAQALEAKYGLSQDYYLNERVNRIGQRLATVCGRNDISYSFKVLNANEVNALACPGDSEHHPVPGEFREGCHHQVVRFVRD